MNPQTVLTLVILLIAVACGGVMLYRRARSFSVKRACGSDCGCGSGSKKTRSTA